MLTSYVLAHPGQRYASLDGPTDKTLVGLIMLNLVVLAPLAEELFFRGWLFTALRLRFGFIPVLLVVSALFAAFHWDRRHMILVLPLAFALGLIREQAGSIKPTIALHAAYNLTIIAVTLLVQYRTGMWSRPPRDGAASRRGEPAFILGSPRLRFNELLAFQSRRRT